LTRRNSVEGSSVAVHELYRRRISIGPGKVVAGAFLLEQLDPRSRGRSGPPSKANSFRARERRLGFQGRTTVDGRRRFHGQSQSFDRRRADRLPARNAGAAYGIRQRGGSGTLDLLPNVKGMRGSGWPALVSAIKARQRRRYVDAVTFGSGSAPSWRRLGDSTPHRWSAIAGARHPFYVLFGDAL